MSTHVRIQNGRLADAVQQLERYGGDGIGEDILDVLDALVGVHDDRTNMRNEESTRAALARAVEALGHWKLTPSD